MKKISKILLLILLLFTANKVYAATNLTFDNDSPILEIYDSNYMTGDLGGINRYYIPSNKNLNFKLSVSGKKTSWIKRGKEVILEDIKPETIDINLSSSSNITCHVNNARSDIYNLSASKFSLINTSAELAETYIGSISCTPSSTDNAIILSSYNWINISITTHNKNYVNNLGNDEMVAYRFNLGIINPTYLSSLCDSKEITSVSVEGKNLDDKPYETKNENIKVSFTRNSNKNKITIKLFDESNTEKLNTGLTDNEKSFDLQYGPNYLKIYETTEKHTFISSLGNNYKYYNFTENDFKYNTYESSYTINRLDTRSKTNTLKSLSISDIDFDFKTNTYEYNLKVPNKVSSIKITSTLNDDKSVYVSGFGNRTINLAEGLNEVLMKVKAENGDIRTYTFKITREKNNDASLSKLVINDKEIILKEDLLIYSVILDNKIVTPDIKATPNDDKAKVTISELKELAEGSNKVTITVKAQNDDELVYEIDIIRDALVSINSKLKSITIKDHPLDFYPDVNSYTLDIDKSEKSLVIMVTPENDKATYKIIGNEKLKDKSVITIEVTAEDNKNKSIYKIKVHKETIKINPFLIISVVLVMLICVTVFITRKNKRY